MLSQSPGLHGCSRNIFSTTYCLPCDWCSSFPPPELPFVKGTVRATCLPYVISTAYNSQAGIISSVLQMEKRRLIKAHALVTEPYKLV